MQIEDVKKQRLIEQCIVHVLPVASVIVNVVQQERGEGIAMMMECFYDLADSAEKRGV